MKVKITGASNFINRMFEAAGSFQWAREFLKNSLEAKASKVEFGIEWEAVKKHGIYRRTIVDNGEGMSRTDLLKFFSTLGEGGKPIGGVHENFGVGAKIASLPWNPNGVVVISYHKGVGSLIWIVLDEDTKDYELVEFSNGAGQGKKSCVVDPDFTSDGIHWSKCVPEWARENGTTIILLGSDKNPDTVLGNPEAAERDIKGLSVYLNSRFWDLSKAEVRVLELRSTHKNQWPRGPEESEDERRFNGRQCYGAKHYLTEVEAKGGKLRASDTLPLQDGKVQADWYLWEGERPAIHSYAQKNGYIALRYGDELFELTQHKVNFRHFGIIEAKVQQALTIILEPKKYEPGADDRWGIHPDQSRNRLIFTSPAVRGAGIPLADWGLDFAEHIPDAILEAIQEARGELSGSIEDEEYRKRLQDKFGSRWTLKRFVKARGKEPSVPASDLPQSVEAQVPSHLEIEEVDRASPEERDIVKKRIDKTIHRKKVMPPPDGSHGTEGEAPVDVPRFRYARADSFERPYHMALWAPHDPEGPTVLINVDSHILGEVVKYHQDAYPDVYAEEVAEVVRHVFGEVAACKIAHTQKLAQIVPEEELDRDYRSEPALTTALMGLLAEETVIHQRLGLKLGKHKPPPKVLATAPATVDF